MSDWNRSTQQITLDNIRPEHKQAIDEYIETYNFGDILQDALVCIETTSIKEKKKLFGGKKSEEVVQTAIVTPRWLLIALHGDQQETTRVLSIQLQDAVAQDYKQSPAYRMIPDEGLNITGAFTGIQLSQTAGNPVTNFLGLGPEPVAEAFKTTLIEAIQKAKL